MRGDVFSAFPQANSPGSRVDANLLVRMLNSHPGRQQYRWFQNFLNPDGAGMTKETPQEGRYVRVEVEGTFTGIFDVHRTTRTYREAFGYLDESSTTLLYDPSKTELMMGDHVLPWGKGQNGVDVSNMVSPQSLLRGHQRSTGAGRVSTDRKRVV